MNGRRWAEYERLDADHPEWQLMATNEVHPRFWMYFRDDVAMARAAAHWRRIVTPVLGYLVKPVLNYLARKLERNHE